MLHVLFATDQASILRPHIFLTIEEKESFLFQYAVAFLYLINF